MEKIYNWYKKAVVGLTPFGIPELTDKTRTHFTGNAGGDEAFGVFEPSDGNHHPNDYFSESKNYPTLEKMMIKKRKEKKNKKNKKKKIAQKGTDIIEVVFKATVTINCFSEESQEIGSGFFIGPNIVLTCSHVVVPEMKNVKRIVRFENVDYEASIWAYDVGLDVAIVVVNDPSFVNNNYLKLASSNQTKPGEEVMLIGTPLGFENIVGKGIISSIPISYPQKEIEKNYMFISMDIMPGNSGGPVARMEDGAVIGIAEAMISAQGESQQGLNAIMPIDDVKNFLKDNGINYEYQEPKNVV